MYEAFEHSSGRCKSIPREQRREPKQKLSSCMRARVRIFSQGDSERREYIGSEKSLSAKPKSHKIVLGDGRVCIQDPPMSVRPLYNGQVTL